MDVKSDGKKQSWVNKRVTVPKDDQLSLDFPIFLPPNECPLLPWFHHLYKIITTLVVNYIKIFL